MGPSKNIGDPTDNYSEQSNNESVNGATESIINGEVNDNMSESDASSDPSGDSTSAPASPSVEEQAHTENSEETTKTTKNVYIQDSGFSVTIDAPGLKKFDISVTSMELVQEIHQVLMDREDCCHRTCFSLQLNGVTLDNFADLKNVENLKEGSLLKVVEEPYTVREARIHVRHVRDLLKSMETSDSFCAVDGMSLTYLYTLTGGDITDKRRDRVDSVDCTPPDYAMPGACALPLAALHPELPNQKTQCLKVITYSGWNPPPGNRRMHGDLLYLVIVTAEDKKYHITSCTRGFYVNQSTDEEFNPRAESQPHLCHSLIDLLSQISSSFKRGFQSFIQRRAQKHPFERVATPFPVHSWMAPSSEHSIDYIRAEDAFSTRLGYEEHLPGQSRDWNEELQTCRELPRASLAERLFRERTIFKAHSDFVNAATRGAVSVIDGSIMPINPGEEQKHQMFLWNNIFFSLGFDVKDHYKEFGGDSAAHVAPANDLKGVRALSALDPEGLYTLGTLVVDYRGFRVTAQSIIPGILEKEQEQSVVYGSVDFGKTIVRNEKYLELLEKVSSQLKVRKHRVIDEKDEELLVHSSVECKGIIGNDSRHYVLDLLRTFPPDVHFIEEACEDLSDEMRKLGFPRSHPHRFPCLRQELVDAFVENRYVAFVKIAAMSFQQLRLDKQRRDIQEAEKKALEKSEEKEGDCKEDLETEEAKKLVESVMENDTSLEDSSREVVRKAAQAVRSLRDTQFEIAFNTDVYQPHVKHADPDGETLKREKSLVCEAAEYLIKGVIPSLIKEFQEHSASPVDGITLTEALHSRGVNMRYLGHVTELLAQQSNLAYIHRIAVGELVTRAAKRLWRRYSQSVPATSLAAALAHFLNCLLGSCPTAAPQANSDELQSKTAKRRNKRRNKTLVSEASSEWWTETPRSLWRSIANELQVYYCYKLQHCDSCDTLVEWLGVHKHQLLRSFCRAVGLQLRLRQYALDSRSKPCFNDEDVLNLYPIVKHCAPKATDAYHFFSTGQSRIQQGMLREGYELISEALNLLNNVCGPMHPEISACLRLLARLNYILGDPMEALAYQQKAVLMSERVLGVDHPNTITDYTHLSLYCFASGQVSCALRLLYRARYLALLCCGSEQHPDVALLDSNIGLILHAVGEFELSLKFLEHALALNKEFFGADHVKVGLNCQMAARAQAYRGDLKQAIEREKEAYHIYKNAMGEQHERTLESRQRLKRLHQQSVDLERSVKELSRGERKSVYNPLQSQAPPAAGVLEALNAVNGIVFFHISGEELERLRAEILKRQQAGADTESSRETADEAQQNEVQRDETKSAEATSNAVPVC